MQVRIALLTSHLLATLLCNCALAQLTISEPEPAKGPVRQVSSSLPFSTEPWEGIATARHDDALSGTQIRVSVQYLMVDDETRKAIYADLPSTAIKTSMMIPRTGESADLRDDPSPLRSSQQIVAPSRVTSCVLDESDTAAVMKKAFESTSSDIMRSPSVMLLDGKQAEMNDVVQRPFMVDMQQESGLVKPIVHVIDEGTRLRLLATRVAKDPADPSAGPSIRLASELVISRILDVKSEQVFGIVDDSPTVQVPHHQVTSAVASQNLAKGQTLLVDPHVIKTKSFQQESTSVLGRIPYVGRTFKNSTVGSVDQHMLMLLLPSIEENVKK